MNVVTNNIMGTIKSPSETFKRVLKDERNLIVPFFIILSTGVLGGVVGFLLLKRQEIYVEIASFFLAGSILFTVISWIVWAALYTGLSKLLSGSGSYLRILELTGYARAPMLMGSILIIPVFVILFFLSPYDAMGIMFVFLPILLLIMAIWTLKLDIMAVREANNFSTKKALTAVFVSIAIVDFFYFYFYFEHGFISQMYFG